MSVNHAFPFSADDHYLGLRRRLLGFFTARQCNCPADLADETLVRVLVTHTRRPPGCSLDRWTFAVARNVLREWRRGNLRTVSLDDASQALMVSRYLPEFDLDLLPMDDADREFFRVYFIERPGARALALEAGLSEGGVRSRAHGLKTRLRKQFSCTPVHAAVLKLCSSSAR